MSRHEQYITVSVFGLSKTITKKNVQDFFEAHINGCGPVVSTLVLKRDRSKTTTVTIKGGTEKDLVEKIKKFTSPGFKRHPLNDEAGFSTSFHGLTLLYESTDEKPSFDVYFVHGLGGHAFETWATKPDHHANVRMWPRDILPAYLEREEDGAEQLYGRYSTFGYDARKYSGVEMEQSIPETAHALMTAIATSRASTVPVDTPIFLICHSLGGLVACQAVVEILASILPRENFDELLEDRFFHSRHRRCLIRGISFFSTPFEGSKLANMAAPVVGISAGQKSFISALKVKDPQIQKIVQQFDEARKDSQNRIRLVIFYEKKEMGHGLIKTMVTEKQSALSTFNDKVDQRPLLLDHRNIVKFAHESDNDFQQAVGPMIRYMIRSGLAEMSEFLSQANAPIALGRSPSRVVETGAIAMDSIVSAGRNRQREHQPPNLMAPTRLQPGQQFSTQEDSRLGQSKDDPRMMILKSGLFYPKLEPAIKVLYEGLDHIANSDNSQFIQKQFSQVSNPIGRTCDWILGQELYKDWESNAKDGVLFVVGVEGSGKTVLAKSIIRRIAEQQPDSVLAYFFCRSIGTESTPANILRHVILQLENQCEGLILQGIVDQKPAAHSRYDVDLLWQIFRAMCQKVGRPVYVVIDGLDECLQNIRLRKRDLAEDEDPVRRFLGQICDLADISQSQSFNSPSNQSSVAARTAVCFFTRPQEQLDEAIRGRVGIITIDSKQVQRRATQVLDLEISRLVSEEKLPLYLETLVRENLSAKTEATPASAFQWVNTAIERMQDDSGSTTEKLDAIHPGLYASYLDVLTEVSEDEETQLRVSFLLRTLFFAEQDLSADMLEHAFLLSNVQNGSDKKNENPKLKAMELARALRGLLTVDHEVLQFSHQSVRDFFRQLSPLEWPNFSFADHREGNIQMSLLCLQYLARWDRDISLSDGAKAERATQDKSQLQVKPCVAQFTKSSPFIDYALDFWVFHVQQSGNLPSELLSALGRFLEPNGEAYGIAMSLDDYKKGFPFHLPSGYVSPAFTLVNKSLFNLLDFVPSGRKSTFERVQRRFSKAFGADNSRTAHVEKHNPFNFIIDITEANESDITLLHLACIRGSFNTVKLLLDRGASGNARDEDGDTPFSLAVSGGHTSIADLLIDRSQAVAREDEDSSANSLHYAAQNNMEKAVIHLLRSGVDPNIAWGEISWTPLHAAASSGYVSIAKILLKRRANPHSRTAEFGSTPLHLASAFGQTEMCKNLLDSSPGADINVLDDRGESALYYAARGGHPQTVQYLLSRGATMIAEKIYGFTPVHAAAECGHESVIRIIATKENVHTRTFLMDQPIHRASYNGHKSVVEVLIKLGADKNAKTRDYADIASENLVMTPLAYAAARGHQELFEYLLEIDVEVEGFLTFDGETLLTLAARGGNAFIGKVLMEKYNLDPLHQSGLGQTPLSVAAAGGDIEILRMMWDFLDESSRNIDVQTEESCTPLLGAAENSHQAVVQFCLDQGASLSKVDPLGRNAIQLLVLFATDAVGDSLATLKILIEGGASVNQQDFKGLTPLHGAARSGREDLLLALLQAGAKVDAAEPNEGWCPLHIAASVRHAAAYAMLLKWGADPYKLDYCGHSPIQYAGNFHPIVALTQQNPEIDTDSPLDLARPAALLRELIKEKLAQRVDLLPGTHHSVKGIQWASDAAQLLFRYGREEDAIIAVEYGFVKFGNKAFFRSACSGCGKSNQEAPFWVCRGCRPAIVFICSSCHEERDEGKIFRGCSTDHSLMQVAGGDFMKLTPGTVRKDGLTMAQWLENLREEFGVVPAEP